MSLLSPLVPAFPNNLTNGTPADASQVMADFNTLRNAVNNVLNATGATGGDQYVGLTTDSRFNGTSVHDALTQLIDRQSLYTDTGTTNALVITPTPAMTALTAGQAFWFKPANTTTSGTATINISGLGTVGLANQDGTLLLAGQLIAGSYYLGVTAGPGNPIRVIDPSRINGSFTITLTGFTSGNPTGTVNYAIGSDGKGVDVWFPSVGINNTNSNATSMNGTGVPSVLSATTAKTYVIFVLDSGTATWGNVAGLTTTTWTFNKNNVGTGNFTASGTKGIPTGGVGFRYTLD